MATQQLRATTGFTPAVDALLGGSKSTVPLLVRRNLAWMTAGLGRAAHHDEPKRFTGKALRTLS